MNEQKIERTCTVCGIHKSLDEFYVDIRGRYGHFAKCKLCCNAQKREYRKTKQGRYVHRNSARISRLKFPEKIKARNAVNNRIRDGQFIPATSCRCQYCESQASEYHHESYGPNERLRVIPICSDCHRRIHYEKQTG